MSVTFFFPALRRILVTRAVVVFFTCLLRILLDDPEGDLLAEQIDEHRYRLGQLLLVLRVIDVHDLVLSDLLGQGLVGRDQADVIDDSEAGQGHLLGLVILVQEEVSDRCGW